MNFKTHVFSLYSHLLIYVSMQLPTYTRYIWTGCSRWFVGIGGVPEDDDWVNSVASSEAKVDWVLRCSQRARFSELGCALGGVIDRVWSRLAADSAWQHIRGVPGNEDGPNSDIHSEAVIKRVWRCTVRLRSSVFRCTWRQWSSEVGDALAGHNRVNLEMHCKAVIGWVCRCTCRLWTKEIGGVLGGGGSQDSRWEAHGVLILYSSVS